MIEAKAKALDALLRAAANELPFIQLVAKRHPLWSHKWLKDKKHRAAVRIASDVPEDSALLLVTVEWLPRSRPGDWYLVGVAEKALGTTEIEFHHTAQNGTALRWNYPPRKHDGLNAKRAKRFAAKYPLGQAHIAFPTSVDAVSIFVEEIQELVADRRRADALGTLEGAKHIPPDSANNDAGFPEGEEFQRYIVHRHRERKLRMAKINEVLESTGGLACEVPGCTFDFKKTYGALGDGFAHVHHITPLSSLKGIRITKLDDLAIVCANCHAMIHLGGKSRSLIEVSPTHQP
ncbi:HNH endonuclease [Corallococcus sp. bb12-1]|uniref:HNH endonuclease n=1 Tax=Corallococcus sp. bb12-1 TaxID=2996784 RepID=UPI002270E6EB|nr:HNH endonuclease [Corallococcus sp. bb12-1]MCY1042128.1 HNH endonuclease [Corallococcus sp. bb12-1]